MSKCTEIFNEVDPMLKNDIEETAQCRVCGVSRNVVCATGQGYMPLQRGRTPESWLKDGLAGGERNVRALLRHASR